MDLDVDCVETRTGCHTGCTGHLGRLGDFVRMTHALRRVRETAFHCRPNRVIEFSVGFGYAVEDMWDECSESDLQTWAHSVAMTMEQSSAVHSICGLGSRANFLALICSSWLLWTRYHLRWNYSKSCYYRCHHYLHYILHEFYYHMHFFQLMCNQFVALLRIESQYRLECHHSN